MAHLHVVGNGDCSYKVLSQIFRRTEGCTVNHLKSLATELNVRQEVVSKNISDFSAEYSDYENTFKAILSAWCGKKASEATLDVLIRALKEVELGPLAVALQKQFKISNGGSKEGNEESSSSSSKQTEDHSRTRSRKRKLSNSEDEVDEVEDELDFSKIDKPLTVLLTPPNQQTMDRTDDYNLPVTKKGYAFVLNIMRFKRQKLRNGSLQDVKYMTDLWTKLGYTIFPNEKERNAEEKTAKDVKRLVSSFKKLCEDHKANSIVIFIGSHGVHNKIITSDDVKLDLYQDILNKFDATHCKWLADKPKLYFVNACQNHEKKEETDEILPVDHAILMVAQYPGFVACRGKKFGSRFTYCVTDVFMKNAYKDDVRTMMDSVQDKLKQAKGTKKYKQMARVIRDGLGKLYFKWDTNQ